MFHKYFSLHELDYGLKHIYTRGVYYAMDVWGGIIMEQYTTRTQFLKCRNLYKRQKNEQNLTSARYFSCTKTKVSSSLL